MQLKPLSPKIIPFDWQLDASERLLDGMFYNGKPVSPPTNTLELVENNHSSIPSIQEVQLGKLLRAGTGTGKMYMCAQACRTIIERNLLYRDPTTINPFPILWLMPKSVKTQTQRVVSQYGLAGMVMVMSYSELKSSMGEMYVEWVNTPTGEIIPLWKPNMLPGLIICDECQVLKNPNSLQARMIRSLPQTVKSIFASATPFQRVIDSRTLLERVGAKTKYNVLPASSTTSERILANIASPKSVNEYSPIAVERLRTELSGYIVELKNVRFKHPSKTSCVNIYFKNEAERKHYAKIYYRLVEALRKLRASRGNMNNNILILVEMQKMQQAAELLRCNQIAERVVANVGTKAVIVASNFRETLAQTYRFLTIHHKIDPARIAVIQGGQKMEERQLTTDEFQSGKRDICLFTMRSGGVGISLHHDRVTTKPRHIILPPTWSAIDLVQALGRGHRLTSLSTTTQEILWYAETIEERVKQVVQNKVKCLSKAVTAKEQFVSIFEKGIEADLDEQDELAELVESKHHEGEDTESDDVTEDEYALTGEGLSND